MSYIDTLKDFETRLGRFCKDVTNLKVTFRNASNQKLKEQHIQLHIDRVNENGWEHLNPELTDSGNFITSKEYELFVECSCHRGDYTQAVLGEIRHQLSTNSGLYYKYFGDSKFSYLRSATIQKRFFTVDGIQYEERSVMQLVFNMMVESSDIEDIGSIETVEIINLKTKVSEDTVAVDDTLTITYP